jgi:hypothetical protein
MFIPAQVRLEIIAPTTIPMRVTTVTRRKVHGEDRMHIIHLEYLQKC